MLTRITTPERLFAHRLGAALTMEHHGQVLLLDLDDHARRPELRARFHERAVERDQQIDRLHRVFAILELHETPQPSPMTKGLARQTRTLLARTRSEFVDAVLLSAALQAEHLEVGAYRTLLATAQAWEEHAAVDLLLANLRQEELAAEQSRVLVERICAGALVDRTAGQPSGVVSNVGFPSETASARPTRRR